MNRVIRRLSLCCLIMAGTAHGETALQEVMQALSNVSQTEVRYREEKHLAILDVPLQQSGRLIYIAPDKYIRSLDAPGGGRFIVDGDQVIVEKGGREKRFNLDEMPGIKAFIASFGATLSGDLPRLQKFYVTTFSGRKEAWELDLKPSEKRLAAQVSHIRLWGRKDKIEGMEIHETNGDWSQMLMLHE